MPDREAESTAAGRTAQKKGRKPMSQDDNEKSTILSELMLLSNILSTLIEGKNRKRQGGSLAGVERDFIDVVLDAAGALIVVYDREGKIVCFNRACEETTGFTSQEVIGRYVWDLSPPGKEAERVRQEFEGLGVGRSANSFETAWVGKGGGRRVITWEHTVLPEENATEGYVIGIGIDVTGSRQLEENLRESEAKYRRLIETASDAIFLADAETGIILDVNEKAGELFGLPPEKIIGIHQYRLHPREEALQYRAIFEEAVRKGGGNFNDLFILRSDGGKVPVDISASVTEIGGKRVIQGIFRDIREKKGAQEVLKLREKQYRILAEASRDHVYIVNRDMVVTYVNAVSADLLGKQQEQVAGRPLASLLSGPMAETMLEAVRSVFKTGVPWKNPDCRLSLPGGDRRVDTQIVPIATDEGVVTEVLGISRELGEGVKTA